MSGTLRRPHQFIIRTPGGYVDGEYVPASEAPPVGILAGVQPASAADYQRMEADRPGRRLTGLLRIYTDTALNVAGDGDGADKEPGDILLGEDGKRYLLIGKADRHVLRTSVSHYRYLAVMEVENVSGEKML